MEISDQARTIIGIMLITLPTIEGGGAFLLSRLRKQSGYSENGFALGTVYVGAVPGIALV